PMFILCGVFYPVSALPALMQSLVQLLPLTHAIALIRPLVAGTEISNVVTHLLVLLTYAAAGLYTAVVLTRRRLIL
ncbi:MAG: ABC transporter permease, partial [Gammaproteobacteria bacterium]